MIKVKWVQSPDVVLGNAQLLFFSVGSLSSQDKGVYSSDLSICERLSESNTRKAGRDVEHVFKCGLMHRM